MSRRRWQNHVWFRSITALFGVWFFVATTEVISLHACPMHEGRTHDGRMHDGRMHGERDAGTPVAAMAMADMNMSDTDMTAMHMSHHAGHTTPANGTGSPEGHHNCTCISTCCAATTTPLAAIAVSLTIAGHYSDIARVVTPSFEAPRVRWIDFLLPFANAPPVSTNA